MSNAEIERFVNDVKKDAKLQEEVKKAGADEAAVANFAKGKGYDFTADELKKHAEEKKGELSDDQLDKVAGGGTTVTVAAVVVVAT